MRRLLFECYDRTFEGMTDSEWRVFCAICKHANDDTGGDCFPSTSLLAKESRLHKNTVPPQIKSLEEKKWIRTEQESGKRRYFFVDVGRIFSCPRIGGNYSVPLQEPVPLNNSVPLQEPVADGYRKIEGTGTESCTRREQLKEQEENSIVNDVYGKQGLPSTTITGTVNDVYGKGKQRLPITDKEQIKNRQVLIGAFASRAEVQMGADLFDGLDQKANRGAAKTEKTQRNSLIQKENRGAPLMVPSPADSANEIASNSLIQKENEGADTPARTSVKKAAKEEPRGTRFTLEELPDEWREECRRIQPKADPAKVFEEFRDHWIAQPGAKGRKSDWTATWRNWCRRINARDLERVGYEPGRAQFMVKPEPVNPFKVTPQNCPPRQKTEEELEAERSFDLFERVLNGEV